MKEIWVLSVKTSLPRICHDANSLTTVFYAFESFDTAKEAFRAEIKKYAFSKNHIFDGKGHIKALHEYIKHTYESGEEDEEEGILTNRILAEIENGLCSAIEGNGVSLKIKKSTYDDGSIAVRISAKEVIFGGIDELNGYCPILRANFFKMDKEQDYYFYVNPQFGYAEEGTAELYVDLKKTVLNP